MIAPTLVIGNKNYSSWSLRPWIFLRKNDIPFDEEQLWLDEPDFKPRVNRYNSGGKVPVLQGLTAQDQGFLTQIQKLVGDADEAYGHFRLRRAAAVVMELAQLGNVYFDAKKPWVAAKDPKTHDDMNNTIACFHISR